MFINTGESSTGTHASRGDPGRPMPAPNRSWREQPSRFVERGRVGRGERGRLDAGQGPRGVTAEQFELSNSAKASRRQRTRPLSGRSARPGTVKRRRVAGDPRDYYNLGPPATKA